MTKAATDRINLQLNILRQNIAELEEELARGHYFDAAATISVSLHHRLAELHGAITAATAGEANDRPD